MSTESKALKYAPCARLPRTRASCPKSSRPTDGRLPLFSGRLARPFRTSPARLRLSPADSVVPSCENSRLPPGRSLPPRRIGPFRSSSLPSRGYNACGSL